MFGLILLKDLRGGGVDAIDHVCLSAMDIFRHLVLGILFHLVTLGVPMSQCSHVAHTPGGAPTFRGKPFAKQPMGCTGVYCFQFMPT